MIGGDPTMAEAERWFKFTPTGVFPAGPIF